ncbi:MAG: hypothetical protein IID33_00985 [Planctomycetes bacterium]|nr:hypothetical protein [Planctomycetota bacterium]
MSVSWLSDLWPPNLAPNVGLVVTAVIMFALFLFSRYAAGMGRVSEWHLLRAGGSYMLGNTIVAFLLVICLALQLTDASLIVWEKYLSFVVSGLMMLLGGETILNFVADIYRPRIKGVEPRACYDSRILGVFSEPGGIAHSIAEAVNYQFGFQVSQTWFYRFLARYLVPVMGVGALALWLMTCLVVVNPYERVVIERFGKLVEPDKPLRPGLVFKLPWPLSVAHVQSTDELRQIIIGAKFREVDHDEEHPQIILWTDSDHAEEHFNFLVAIRPDEPGSAAGGRSANDDRDSSTAVHILQLSLAVQYRVVPSRVADYLSGIQNPEDLVRNVAWRELIEFIGTADVDGLLGERRTTAGATLQERISERLGAYGLGIDVVYVGLQAIHPVPTVAKSFQDVIIARQEKTATIRTAEMQENQALSQVAGDRSRALKLVESIDNRDHYMTMLAAHEKTAGSAPPSVSRSIAAHLVELAPRFLALVNAQLATDRAKATFERGEREYELGISGTPAELESMRSDLNRAEAARIAAQAALDSALGPVREQAKEHLSASQIDALITTAHARIGLQFWNRQLESQFLGLGGLAAQIMAEAQAERWETENQAEADLARLRNERRAYRAAPELYKQRKYLEALVLGLMDARKYFLAFDPGDRDIKIRVEAQEVIGPDFSLTGE